MSGIKKLSKPVPLFSNKCGPNKTSSKHSIPNSRNFATASPYFNNTNPRKRLETSVMWS
jgi:hypothetical protein